MNIQIENNGRFKEGVYLVGIMEESMFENVGLALHVVQKDCILLVHKVTRSGINCYVLNDELEAFQFDTIGETIDFAKKFPNLSAAELLLLRNEYPREEGIYQ